MHTLREWYLPESTIRIQIMGNLTSCINYFQYPCGRSSVPARISSAHEGKLVHFSFKEIISRELMIFTGTVDLPHGYCRSSSRVLMIWLMGTVDLPHGSVLMTYLTGTADLPHGTDDMPHGYCRSSSRVMMTCLTGPTCRFSSQVLMTCLTSTLDLPHGYWWYASRVLMTCLTGTDDMPHWYCRSSSRVLMTCLTGTVDLPHGYWWHASQVLMACLMGTDGMPHRYWWSSPDGYYGYKKFLSAHLFHWCHVRTILYRSTHLILWFILNDFDKIARNNKVSMKCFALNHSVKSVIFSGRDLTASLCQTSCFLQMTSHRLNRPIYNYNETSL